MSYFFAAAAADVTPATCMSFMVLSIAASYTAALGRLDFAEDSLDGGLWEVYDLRIIFDCSLF
jgi:hypothetical protein